MRTLFQLAYSVRRALLGLLRIRTAGVKVMLFSATGELLLIRNSYGDTHQYLLPGGGVGRRESAAQAALREVREELGVDAELLDGGRTYESSAEGKRDTVHLFRATTAGSVQVDGREVVEARFFALDALPAETSPATLRRIAEVRGERQYDGRW